MDDISTSRIRNPVSAAVNRVAYNKERIMIHRQGRKVAAMVPVEDLKLLERLEEESDLQDARNAMKEKGENLSWEKLKEELDKKFGLK
jgi:PHD/YefM family antitoxin component YafN of YafNO toxin-antitoxin module